MIIRSQYTIQQFRQVLSALAHKVAIEAVTKLQQSMKITTEYSYDKNKKPAFDEVSVENYWFKFNYNSILFKDHEISFEVEEKLYQNTNHCTKINARAVDDSDTEAKTRIEKYIEKMMAAAGLKPEGRFKLAMVKPN